MDKAVSSACIRHAAQEGLLALFPHKCAFCGRVCSENLVFPGICRICLAGIPFRTQHQAVIKWPDTDDKTNAGESSIRCATWYQEPIRSAILRLKFADAPDVAEALASVLIQCWRNCGLDCRAVIAVPLHDDRLRERGYNQAALLAERVAKQLDRPDWSGCLVREKKTERQSSISDPISRRINMAGAFRLAKGASGFFSNCSRQMARPVLLIDDILTTGVTLTEAAQPLREIGLPVCGLIVSSAHQAVN